MNDEFELIANLTRDLPTNEHVVLGPGDDAAALRVDGNAVVSTDILVENVHFKRAWSTPEQVGRKAVAVNVSDIEAMGALPVAVVVALAFPQDLDEAWLQSFADGVRAECELAGVSLVGGDLSRSDLIVCSVTAIGDLGPREAVTRSGAKPGDVVATFGKLGWAAAGHAALSRGFRSPKDVVRLALQPEVAYGQGIIASAAGATAMMDVSDGLMQDLGHIATSSGVAIDVDTEALEVTDPMTRVGAATGKDPLTFVLGGGEDYALVATFPDASHVPDEWRIIGRVTSGEGVTVDGSPSEFSGWNHFA
uniref:thiamine-phosphate kinase n=1 Tax=Tessaracoccus timonensis TaxID=2161816 RepID=UPI000D553566|nr:thiamine-phosphate kinase [Tessaracoccus timonensis]